MFAPAVFLAAITHAAPAPEPPSLALHVSPAGRDTWSGSLEAPNIDNSDGPLATIGAARDAIRARKARGELRFGSGVSVQIHPGVYYLEQPLVFSPEDSGWPGHYARYEKVGDGPAIISGGREIGGWRRDELRGKPIWIADIPPGLLLSAPSRPDAATSSSPPLPFREIFVGGRRRTLARHPDRGFLHIEDVPDLPPNSQWTDGKNYLRFAEGDAAVWQSAIGAEAVVFMRWIDNHLRIASVDPAKRIATFTRRAMFLLNAGDLYHLEGSLAFLDSPGEWCIDSANSRICYIPVPDEDPPMPESFAATVPVLGSVLRLEGDPEHNRFVEYMTFEGLTFSHAHWWFPPDFKPAWPSSDACGFQQAAWGVPGAVVASGARNSFFNFCTVSHVAGYGVEIGRACYNVSLYGCTLTDLGAGGVKIGETIIREAEADRTHENSVEDCTITDGGHIHHQAVAVWVGQSADNTISHNVIRDFDYSGISIGWTWGYGPSLAGGNVVRFNDVGFLGLHPRNTEPPLGDMGGIYTLGSQPGTRIENNFFHDIAGRTIAWGIYFDEGSSGILAENNIVTRTTHGGFHQHFGRDNTVRNNVLAFGRDAQVWKTRREEHLAFTFTRNIVLYQTGDLLRGDWSGGDFELSKNLYWRLDSPEGAPQDVRFPGNLALGQWQQAAPNHDPDSIIANPLFVDSARDNFTLHDDSPARALGFVPIDLTSFGPRNKARTPR
jgi:hypothetical protein